MRFFNTAGPVRAEDHYAIPPLKRGNVGEILVNGGGRIEREYGLGRGRTDLLVLWPREAGAPYDLWRRFVIECKVLRDSDRRSLEATVERGVEQTLGYMGKCNAEEGHLVVIDRRGAPAEPCLGEELERDGRRVAVWTL